MISQTGHWATAHWIDCRHYNLSCNCPCCRDAEFIYILTCQNSASIQEFEHTTKDAEASSTLPADVGRT
jgi:hypothetical protein